MKRATPNGFCYSGGMRFSLWFIFQFALLCWARAESPNPAAQSPVAPAASPLLKQGNARVVLVGDSITGQSRNHPAGFAHQIDWALQQVYPGCHPDVVALGGSGAGVQAWLNNEKRSRTDAVFLDVKGIDVKASLEQPADVLVIMLGMNDVLAPYVADDPASLAQWTANYRELVTALQSRLKPTVTAVATATLCTEDPISPKNRMMDALNAQLVQLATEMHLLVLPTNQTMRDVLARGRRLKPDFHVTGDFVHPNEAGHLAVAIGMLRGLGEAEAARAIEEQRLRKLLDKVGGEWPAVSYEATPFSVGSDSEKQKYRVRYWMTQAKDDSGEKVHVTVSGAAGWEVTPSSLDRAEGEFTVAGVPDRLENLLTLNVTTHGHAIAREIKLPAPWLVATGVMRKSWNDRQPSNPNDFRGPVEKVIEQGTDFRAVTESGPNQPATWKRYDASVNFTGGNSPDSVDFAALAHARNFEAGYGARWIHSDRDRPVNVELSTQSFAGYMHLAVWLNGAEIYSGIFTSEPHKKKTVEAHLRAGWNTLVFNLNHSTWQWQCSVHLAPTEGDSLDDLRYSTVLH